MNKKIYRSRDNKTIAGVCGGLGEYFDIDPTIIRLVLVLVMFPSFFSALVVYIIFAMVVPLEPLSSKGEVEDEIIIEARKEM